jgi:hypothetical protein
VTRFCPRKEPVVQICGLGERKVVCMAGRELKKVRKTSCVCTVSTYLGIRIAITTKCGKERGGEGKGEGRGGKGSGEERRGKA